MKSIEEIATANSGFLTASIARENGVRSRNLADAVKRNELIRVARGLYCTPDTWEDEYVVAQYRFARGVFSHDTALYLLGLCDSAPESLTMSFPRGYNPSSAKAEGIVAKSSPKGYTTSASPSSQLRTATWCAPTMPSELCATRYVARRRLTCSCSRRRSGCISRREGATYRSSSRLLTSSAWPRR